RAALSLDSIGDTVYVAANGTAQRREVELGFQEGDLVEVVKGLEPGESIVVVGQDGLSDGTPIRVLSAMSTMSDTTPDVGKSPDQVHQEEYPQAPPSGESDTPRGRGGFPGRRGGGPPDFSKMSPEQVQRIRVRMKARGLTDAQIDERMGSSRKTRKEGGR
ncbi:MAG: hypothetical protein V3S30_11155, partial [Thermoanaerobaculia bacterium]